MSEAHQMPVEVVYGNLWDLFNRDRVYKYIPDILRGEGENIIVQRSPRGNRDDASRSRVEVKRPFARDRIDISLLALPYLLQ